jgi:hypothetical protein
MTVHLTLQAGLQDAPREIAEEPARAGQLHSLDTSTIDELLSELLIGNRLIRHWSYSPASHRPPSQTRNQSDVNS